MSQICLEIPALKENNFGKLCTVLENKILYIWNVSKLVSLCNKQGPLLLRENDIIYFGLP